MIVDNSITSVEEEAIDKFRSRMKGNINEEMYDDAHMFLRFLRACSLNVDNAELMLKKHLEWRKKYNVENISEFKVLEVIDKYLKYTFIGYDKEGFVVRYCPIGNIDINGVLASSRLEDRLKTAIYELEWDVAELEKQSKKHGRNIDKAVLIGDCKNLTFAKVTNKRAICYIRILFELYLNNYPERLKEVYAINASPYFTMGYSFIKTFVPSSILNKVHIYSDDSYKEDLLKVIDAETLPAFLGGKKTDPDGNPLCLTFINHCEEKVPEKYYITRDKRVLSKQPGVQKITLSSASFHEIKLKVDEIGSFLEWEFETKSRDIGFGLFFEELCDGEEKVTELVAIQRIDTDEYPEVGTMKCDKVGTYVIVFDNTYSWVRGKEVYYRVKIVPTSDFEEH